jgi:ribonuclease P protein component
LFQSSEKISCFPLTILFRPNQDGISRFLFCSQRNAKTAVNRNRIKRRLREAVSSKLGSIPQGYDIALIAHKAVVDMKFSELLDSLEKSIRIFEGKLQKQ